LTFVTSWPTNLHCEVCKCTHKVSCKLAALGKLAALFGTDRELQVLRIRNPSTFCADFFADDWGLINAKLLHCQLINLL
jgi:hypothetical protein